MDESMCVNVIVLWGEFDAFTFFLACFHNKNSFRLRNVIDDGNNKSSRKRIWWIKKFVSLSFSVVYLFEAKRVFIYLKCIWDIYLLNSSSVYFIPKGEKTKRDREGERERIECISARHHISFAWIVHIRSHYISSALHSLLEYTKLVKCYYKIAFLFNCTHGMCNFHWYISK